MSAVDLDQFRGKRALVLGMSPDGGVPHLGLRIAVAVAKRTLGLSLLLSLDGEPTNEAIARFVAKHGLPCVLVVGERRLPQAHAAGVPVLRVRRDGSVEVESE